MTEYAQGGLILDEPTYENVARILEMMTRRPCKEMSVSNPTDPTNLRFDTTVSDYLCFYGDPEKCEPESWVMNPAQVERMMRGERIRYRFGPVLNWMGYPTN